MSGWWCDASNHLHRGKAWFDDPAGVAFWSRSFAGAWSTVANRSRTTVRASVPKEDVVSERAQCRRRLAAFPCCCQQWDDVGVPESGQALVLRSGGLFAAPVETVETGGAEFGDAPEPIASGTSRAKPI